MMFLKPFATLPLAWASSVTWANFPSQTWNKNTTKLHALNLHNQNTAPVYRDYSEKAAKHDKCSCCLFCPPLFLISFCILHTAAIAERRFLGGGGGHGRAKSANMMSIKFVFFKCQLSAKCLDLEISTTGSFPGGVVDPSERSGSIVPISFCRHSAFKNAACRVSHWVPI